MSAEDSQFSFRTLRRDDDAAIAAIIREVMTEFGACGEGFAIVDPEVDGMTEAYAGEDCAYKVVVDAAGVVLGGAGFAPLIGAPPDERICELRKMYFRREVRGAGVGRALLRRLLQAAADAGHRAMYIETLTGMDAAVALYRSEGFRELDAPRGATGHFGCNTWLIRSLS